MTKILILLGPFVLIVSWFLAGYFQIIDPLYLPSLGDVIKALFNGALFQYQDIWATAYRTIVGFVIAALLAVPLGILIGHFHKAYVSLEFIIDFFRSLPAPALFPLALLLFGIGDTAKIAVAVFVAFWVILVNTIHGVWHTLKLRTNVGKLFGASKFQILRYITFYDALPEIFTGLRTGLSLALILVIVAEVSIGTKFGLGQKIFDSYSSYRIPEMYAYILLIGFLGFSLNWICRRIEKKLIHWSGK